MGLKGGSGDGGVRSYQAPSKVRGKAGYACEGRSVHGGAWGCMEVQRSRRARITGYLTSTTATSAAAPHPCRCLEYRRVFANSKRLHGPGSCKI